MKEPSPRSSRLALAGGLVAVLLVGGGGFLLGQKAAERPAEIDAHAHVASPPPIPVVTEATRRSMGRADLIALASAAADASASGSAAPADVRNAAGRRFELRLPFGCGGPAGADSDAPMRWRYDEGAKALRLHVAPVSWMPSDWWPDAVPAGVEAIEGFWIARPWTASEACPAADERPVATGTDPVTLPGQTLAVAQFFGGEGARQGRRDGKPFTAVVRMAPDAVRADLGFRVRLSGHFARVPGAGPALCRQPGGTEQRPICVIGATVDEVAIENPATGETLATWAVQGARDTEAR